MAAAKSSSVPASGLTTVSVVNMPPGLSGTVTCFKVVDLVLLDSQCLVYQIAEKESDQKKNSKPLKEKTTKAERRALQEAQRAAKAAAKGAFFFNL